MFRPSPPDSPPEPVISWWLVFQLLRVLLGGLLIAMMLPWGFLAYWDFGGGTCDHPLEFCLQRGGRSLIVAVAFGMATALCIRPARRVWPWLGLASAGLVAVWATTVWRGDGILHATQLGLLGIAAGALIVALCPAIWSQNQ